MNRSRSGSSLGGGGSGEGPGGCSLLVGGEEEERASTCPLLLTPSPTSADFFTHPLAVSTTPPTVMEYDRHQLSPSSVDTENSSLPAVSTNMDFTQDSGSKDINHGSGGALGGECAGALEGSSSSSSVSVLHDSASSAQLLNSRKYLSLATDVNCQENGGLKSGAGLVGLTLGKSTREYGFTSWNWPLIRRLCFWGIAALAAASAALIVAYISTIPTKCDPPTSWYQGSLIYQVFPASFQDSDGNSVGDLRGLSGRLDWIRGLGVAGLRLSWVFPTSHYPEDFTGVENLTRVDPVLGRLSDLAALADALHAANMTLLLDLPLHPFFSELRPSPNPPDPPLTAPPPETHHVIVNNHILVSTINKSRGVGDRNGEKGPVTEIMSFWMDQGVDGFYLEGLENFVNDDNFLDQVEEWKRELYRRSRIGREKVLICSDEVLRGLRKGSSGGVLEAQAKAAAVGRAFHLVEAQLEPFAEGARGLASRVVETTYQPQDGPWTLWSLGRAGGRREASKAPDGNITLAAVLLSLFLPGSTNLLYGDEIGLMDVPDPEGERWDISAAHGLGPMHWETGGGFSKGGVLGWLPAAPSSIKPALAASILRRAVTLKRESPSIYMNAIPPTPDKQPAPNTAIRYVDNHLITVERSYPRRHSFLLLANLSPETVTRDLSKVYYGGTVALDTAADTDKDHKEGRYLSFQSPITVGPGNVLIVKLDK